MWSLAATGAGPCRLVVKAALGILAELCYYSTRRFGLVRTAQSDLTVPDCVPCLERGTGLGCRLRVTFGYGDVLCLDMVPSCLILRCWNRALL